MNQRLMSRAGLVGAFLFFLVVYGFGAIAGGYGHFIDEMYYIACTQRLATGYVDHPPLSIWTLSIIKGIFGTSVLAIRWLPALAGAFVVLVTANLVRKFGGGLYARTLAAIVAALSPVLLIISGFYSMNPFEVVTFLTLIAILLAGDRIRSRSVWFFMVGAIIGIGFLNKHTFVILAAVLLGLFALLGGRKLVWDRRIWITCFGAVLFALPNIIWQFDHKWISLDFYAGAQSKNLGQGYVQTLMNILLSAGIQSLPIWIAGIIFFFRKTDMSTSEKATGRAVAVGVLVLIGGLVITQTSRPDRIFAFFPLLFAAGACQIEKVVRHPALRGLLLFIIFGIGLALLPISVPVFSTEKEAKYTQRLGIVPRIEAGQAAELPQWFADRMGWELYASEIKNAVKKSKVNSQAPVVILASDYGHAAAIELYSPDIGATVVTGHNSYGLWAKPWPQEAIVIGGGVSENRLKRFYEKVEKIGSYTRPMSREVDAPIFKCEKALMPTDSMLNEIRQLE